MKTSPPPSKVPASRSLPVQTVGAFEAKTNLSRYLEDALRGTITIVTRHGKPVAQIVPADVEVRTNMPFDMDAFLTRAREIRARTKRGPESMKELIHGFDE